jgi:hypothetical protein
VGVGDAGVKLVTSPNIGVDTDSLVASANGLGKCADTMVANLKTLQATVTTENPWGKDEPGSLFGMAYVDVLGHALQVFASHVQQIVTAAEGLGSWAQSLEGTEQGNAEGFNKAQRAV